MTQLPKSKRLNAKSKIEYLRNFNKMAGDFSLPSNFEILNKMFSLNFILDYQVIKSLP